MSTLLGIVEKIDPTQIVWCTPERDVYASDTQRIIKERRLDYDLVGSARIAIEISDTVDAIMWMVALDGLAEAVFLAPFSLTGTSDYEHLRREARCTHVVTNEGIRSLAKEAAEVGRATSQGGTNWILATSGTTGTPKLIEHTTASLTRSCKTDFSKGKEFVWGLVYDPFRFAGLQVVLQALSSGSSLALFDDPTDVQSVAEFLRRSGVNALSATPSYWRRLLMTSMLKGYSFRQITLGGEPADQSVLDALRREFPTARIVHIYASTEVGVGFAIRDGLAGFPAEYLRHSVQGMLYAISSTGTLLIARDGESSGYADTGDLVEERDGRIHFLGRDSGSINVGGNKVIPEQVEAEIRRVSGVHEVLVKPKSSGLMGQLVIAEVAHDQSIQDPAAFKKHIITHCRSVLEGYQVPALVKLVKQIPVNSSGKVIRK